MLRPMTCEWNDNENEKNQNKTENAYDINNKKYNAYKQEDITSDKKK